MEAAPLARIVFLELVVEFQDLPNDREFRGA